MSSNSHILQHIILALYEHQGDPLLYLYVLLHRVTHSFTYIRQVAHYYRAEI